MIKRTYAAAFVAPVVEGVQLVGAGRPFAANSLPPSAPDWTPAGEQQCDDDMAAIIEALGV